MISEDVALDSLIFVVMKNENSEQHWKPKSKNFRYYIPRPSGSEYREIQWEVDHGNGIWREPEI